MATPDTTQDQQTFGEPGEPCAQCGVPLAADQRYCLNCGARRGDPRVPYANYMNGGTNGGQGQPGAQQPGQPREWSPLLAIGALAVIGAIFAVGVLIGDRNDNNNGPVTVAGGTGATSAGGSAATASNATFKSDWPSGKDGFTVEIGSLPKDSTSAAQVAAAKSDASSKGASDVGALDSDQYKSLPPGNYVVYSGVYDKKGDATKALKPLKSDFPQAEVIEVSQTKSSGGSLTSGGGGGGSGGAVTATKQDLQALSSKSGAAYEKASKNLPDTIKTAGKPPPTDNQKPGAGTPSQVIK